MLDTAEQARLLLQGESCSTCMYNQFCKRVNKDKQDVCEQWQPSLFKDEQVASVEEANELVRKHKFASLPSTNITEEEIKKLSEDMKVGETIRLLKGRR